MRIVRVPVHGNPHKTATVEDGATVGAKFGRDIYDESGKVLTLAALIALSVEAVPPPKSQVTVSAWGVLLDIPAKIVALAAMNDTAGLLEQTGASTFAKRALGVAAGTSVPTRADADARYSRPAAVMARISLGF